MPSIVFLGAPGVGKGTFARIISPKLRFAHISAGELLRREISKETVLGNTIKNHVNQGMLVPVDFMTKMVMEEIRLSEKRGLRGILLDGFPREVSQAEHWDLQNIHINLIVRICLAEEVLLQKISQRRTCPCCGEMYNLADIRSEVYNMPALLPKKSGYCDNCNGIELIIRSDDSLEVLNRRLALHKLSEEPLIDYWKSKGLRMIDFHVFTGIKQADDLFSIISRHI